MSEFPSWLKSPVPTAFQLGPGLMAGGPAADPCVAVHFPDRRLTIDVLPQEGVDDWRHRLGGRIAAVGDLERRAFVVGAAGLGRPEKIAVRVSDHVGAERAVRFPVEIRNNCRRAFVAGRCPDDLEHHAPGILGARIRGSEKVAIGVHDQGFRVVKRKLPVGGGEGCQGGRGAGVAGGRLLDLKHRADVVRAAPNRGPEDVTLGVDD